MVAAVRRSRLARRAAQEGLGCRRRGGGSAGGGGIGASTTSTRCRCVGDDIARGGAGQPSTADRPSAAALAGQHPFGNGDLLIAGGLVRRCGVLAATVSGPRALRELQAAVVAVAGVDGPVAARLAGGDTVPFAVGSRCSVAREGDTASAEHSSSEGQFGNADVRRCGFTVTSAHTRVIPLVKRLRGQLSGSGGRGRPAIVESVGKRVGFTPRSRGRLLVTIRWTVGSPASIHGLRCSPIGWSSAL